MVVVGGTRLVGSWGVECEGCLCVEVNGQRAVPTNLEVSYLSLFMALSG